MLLCQGLAGNTIGNEGGKALGKALENNSSLQTLNLNREWKKIYMFAGVQERQLALPNKHLLFAYVLYAFVCECVRERERGESAIMSAFGSAFLVLGWGWQGKMCARHVCDSLLLCQWLADNTIGDEGCKALGKALQTDSSMKTLELTGE